MKDLSGPRWPAWTTSVCAALAGLMQALSLAALVALLNRAPSARRGAWLGGVFALCWLAGTFWWLYISMAVYGGLEAPLAVLAVLGLAAFLGSYYTLAAGLYVRWQRRLALGPLAAAGLFAALWTLAELLRGHWFTGFPWGAGGYAQVDGAARWLAPWVGVYGTGALVAAWAAGLASLSRRKWPVQVCLLVLWVLLSWVPAPEQAASSAPLEVSLLQGNIPQDEKFQ